MTTAKKRILHVQTGDGLSGGIANYISILISTSHYAKYENFVITPSLAPGKNEHFLYPRACCLSFRTSYSLKNIFSFYKELREIIKKNRIDIIHAHALRAGFICSLLRLTLKKPLIYTNHGIRFGQKAGLASKIIFLLLEKFTLNVANEIISIRKTDQKVLIKHFPRFEAKLTCITTQIYDPAPVTRGDVISKNLQCDRLVFLGIGSLIPIKNPHRFVTWISIVQKLGIQYEAYWIGGGPLKDTLENESLAKNLAIKWCGQLPQIDLQNILCTASLLFLTSDHETLPLAALEAYANSVPVISSSFSGVEDFILNNHTGKIIESNSLEHFSAIIQDLFLHRNKLVQLSKNSRAYFKEHFSSPEFMAEQYITVIDQLQIGKD